MYSERETFFGNAIFMGLLERYMGMIRFVEVSVMGKETMNPRLCGCIYIGDGKLLFKEDHLVTIKRVTTKTKMGYFLIRADTRRLCKDCKVIPSEYLGPQHGLLVTDVEIKNSNEKKRNVGDPRVRWWNLTEANTTKLLEKVQVEGIRRKETSRRCRPNVRSNGRLH